MAHVETVASVSRPGLRSAAAAARAEVSGIASPPRTNATQSVPISATGDDRAPFQQVLQVSQGTSYESLMLLPRASFAEKLKAGSYVDLQAFCKVVHELAKGSRDDLEGRLISYHDDFVGTAATGQPQLSQSVQDVNMNLPTVPAFPTSNQHAVVSQAQDPLLKSDPWKAFVGSPVKVTAQPRRTFRANTAIATGTSEIDRFLGWH